jgi:hypothetical protein
MPPYTIKGHLTSFLAKVLLQEIIIMDEVTHSKPSVETFSLRTKEIVAPFPDEVQLPERPEQRPIIFSHLTVSGVSNSADNVEFPFYWTRLSHPSINNNPGAAIYVTPRGIIEVNDDDQSSSLRHNPHAVGVVYRELTQRWYIYNLGLEAMAVGAVFNVVVLWY